MRRLLGQALCVAGALTLSLAGGRYALGAVRADQARTEWDRMQAANAVAGAWWLDPVVGLLIAGVAVKEGLEALRGEGCCVSSALDEVGFDDDACSDGCCAH